MKKVLVILGPTASGKTDIALEFAKKYNGELVSCDSRQVYVGLDIGTGKLPGGKWKVEDGRWKKGKGFWEINGIKVWMYDVADSKTQFTVKDYVVRAEKIITDIHQRGKLPIIVGGTGFYLKAILSGLPNLSISVDEKLRGELQELSLLELQEKLETLSPAKWKLLNDSDKQNPRRLTRSIELISMYGYMNANDKRKAISEKYEVLKIGLTAPREILNKRIDDRVISRISQGMIEEAINLHKNGLTFKRMKELGLEYGMLAELLEGKISEDQFTVQLSVKIHQYAKRQMTWFKNPSTSSECIFWFDITENNWQKKLEKMILKWYY